MNENITLNDPDHRDRVLSSGGQTVLRLNRYTEGIRVFTGTVERSVAAVAQNKC